MRTDNKYRVIGALTGAGLAASISIAYQKNQLEKKGEELSWENLNGWQVIICAGLGALFGNEVGSLLYEYKAFHEGNSDFSATSFLGHLLRKESLKSDPDQFGLVIKYRKQIKDVLDSAYVEKLADGTLDAGSFKNRTAIASDYDVDLIVPFRKRSFRTLASMHTDVYKKMQAKFGRNAFVTKGKKTIGITFTEKGREVHFDIAPGREINDFKKDGKLNMYVSAEGFFGNESSQKINVDLQQNIAVNNPEAREIIRVLKLYSLRNSLKIPPVIITQVAVEILDVSSSYSRLENLLDVMSGLADKLRQNCVMDLSNSNNNLLDKMSEYDRNKAIDLILSDIEKIEKNPEYLKEIFKN